LDKYFCKAARLSWKFSTQSCSSWSVCYL